MAALHCFNAAFPSIKPVLTQASPLLITQFTNKGGKIWIVNASKFSFSATSGTQVSAGSTKGPSVQEPSHPVLFSPV